MKKFGTLCFCFVPFLLAIATQFFMMYFLNIMYVITSLICSHTAYADSIPNYFAMLKDNDFSALLMLLYAFVAIVIFGLWSYHNYGLCGVSRRRGNLQGKKFLGILMIVPGMQFATGLLVAFISFLFPSWFSQYETLLDNSGMNDLTLLLILYTVILGPIAEELIFRGVILRHARRAFSFWTANFIQAIFFGVYHMNLLQGCYAFAFGLVLGYICETSGSILYSIWLHILFNAWGTLGVRAFAAANLEILYGLVMLLGIVLCVFGFLLFHQGVQQNKENNLKQRFIHYPEKPIHTM